MVLAELERVLGSRSFSRSPRQAKFLQYLCQKAVAGEDEQIKEYTIAVEVFGRSAEFDQNSESTIRVEAHRLRKRLEKYYHEEGAGNPVRIILPVGHYVPQFLAQVPDEPAITAPPIPPPSDEPIHPQPLPAVAKSGPMIWAVAAVALLIASAGLLWWSALRAVAASVDRAVLSLPVDGTSVHVLAGYPKEQYRDRFGTVWSGDRYYKGGVAERAGDYAGTTTVRFLRAASDLGLFQFFRAGDFSYDIPVKSGIYEMHLYFAETGFGPCLVAGGGENSRSFDVDLNGEPLLDDFDVFANAGDCMTATVLSFKDVRPAKDGKVHLEFRTNHDRPLVNAIELVPGIEGRMLPIRMIVGERSYTDSAGRIWSPDRYFINGQIAGNTGSVKGTSDPDLYANERYGHFSYVLPVPKGRYSVTMHFAETHFGPSHPRKIGGAGSRVFNILANGVALIENLDIFKEAGGDYRAVAKTVHGLRPSAQHNLTLSFVPVTNYASVRAIEVIDEGE